MGVATLHKADILILGAWGCGVFGNDPRQVAKFFKNALTFYSFEKIIFAIHDEKTANIFSFFSSK